MCEGEIAIRPANSADADAISEVVVSTLRFTNAKDYSPEIIERVAGNFSPANVAALIARRDVFVAVKESRIVGTASLDGKVVRTVFVAPEYQGKGIGAALIRAIEQLARERRIETLVVPSSVTA